VASTLKLVTLMPHAAAAAAAAVDEADASRLHVAEANVVTVATTGSGCTRGGEEHHQAQVWSVLGASLTATLSPLLSVLTCCAQAGSSAPMQHERDLVKARDCTEPVELLQYSAFE
jgi:hypothetical protein